MKNLSLISLLIFTIITVSCNSEKSKTNKKTDEVENVISPSDTLTKHLKPFNPDLPTIGLLMFNGVLQGEVIATSDVLVK